MAAAAHPCSSISFNLAGNAPRVPTSSASSLSRGRLPTARKQRVVVGGGRRLALGASEFDASYGFGSSRWSCRFLEASERGHAIRPRVSAGGAGEGGGKRRRPRFLCLHGFRTSGEIMRRQVAGKWPAEVTSRLDLAFADAPFPAQGESPVYGVFDPPYYEWCRFVGENFLDYRNFGECLAKIEELMVREGPFDGLLGFSQGGLLSAALAGLQEQGLALNRVAKLKYVIVISGGKIQSPAMAAEAYANKIKCPSLHFIGDNDWLKTHAEELVESFVDPLVVRHPGGHTVPRLDEKGLRVMLAYLDRIEMGLSPPSSTDAEDKSAGVMTLNLES